MDVFNQITAQFRVYRHRTLRPVGELLIKLRITPHLMTAFSLFFGLAAVYLVFEHYLAFFLFGILHFIADALDGVIASVKGETTFGKYFDHATDNLIAILLLMKIGYFSHDYYAYLATGLYLLAQLVYVFSKLRAPIIFGRTVAMIALFLYLPAIISITLYLPVLVYLFAGIISAYSLARQLQWTLETTFK